MNSLHDTEATQAGHLPVFQSSPATQPSSRLAHSEDEDPEEQLVVLMSALPWPGSADPDHDHYPTLPQLYNALAQRFIDTDCVPFRKYLAIQLGYLYEDCPELASPTFVTILPPDIRQVHLHWLCLYMHTSKTAQHERDIRDRARRGEGRLGPHRGGARRDNNQ